MRFSIRSWSVILLSFCLSLSVDAGQEKPRSSARPGRGTAIIAFPESESRLSLLADGQAWIDLQFVAWGPNWGWMGLDGKATEDSGAAVMNVGGKVNQGGAKLSLSARTAKTGPRQLKMDLELKSDKDTEVTLVVAELRLDGPGFGKGRIGATMADQSKKVTDLPLERKGIGDAVRSLIVTETGGRATTFSFEPAVKITSDDAARIILAEGSVKAASPRRLTLTLDLPADVEFYPSGGKIGFEPGFETWYEFHPDADYARSSEIGMEDWIDAPAGKFGRIERKIDQLLYNGKPIKLWGLNLCYGATAPEKVLADRRSRFYPRYGINAVRLHKFADGPGWAGIQSKESCVEFDPAALDRMDYQVAQFKKSGLYLLLSAHFGALKLGPAQRATVPYMEEFGGFDGEKRITTPHSAIHYSPELQQVQIQQMVNLLTHKNPHTGMTYAEDPAIAFVEIINEQSILFYTSMAPLKASPTLRTQVAKRFCDWLRAKYASQEKLVAAWGEKAFDGFEGDGFPKVGEQLDKDNILPLGNPWYFDPAQLDGSQSFRRQRLLDTMRFLYEVQNEFYDRFVAAVRKAGYAGEIVASNWQAGRAISHYYNLHSDWRVGTIDRHNYFGGGDGNRINAATMLRLAGSGMLSSGMQQVLDRPFMLSEWIHETPNEWGVEGPAILGAYGMGLQGWDVSFMFQNGDNGAFSDRIGRDRWDVTAPHVLGVFPAVARQVHRGDVSVSPVTATMFVDLPSMEDGKLGFQDQVDQQYDIKTFGSDAVPAAALAAVRCAVEFTQAFRPTPKFDLSRFASDSTIVSSTGQLRWTQGLENRHAGFFTINTPGTRAVTGFAEGKRQELGSVAIELKSRFAAIYVSAKQKDMTIETAPQLLITAIARARNTGMKVFNDDRILDKGKGPVLMEPVKARIQLPGRSGARVILLDHNGCRSDKILPVSGGAVEIDGARDKTCYYLVEYAE